MDLSTFLYICRKCGKQKKPTEEFCEACRALPQKQVHTPAFIKPEQPKPPIKQITPQPQAAFDGKSPQLIDTGLEKKKSGANMEASENQKWVYLCPNCKKQVRASAKFCGNCGKLLTFVIQALPSFARRLAREKKVPLKAKKHQASLQTSTLGRGSNQETEQEEIVTIGDIERRGGILLRGNPRVGKTTLVVNLILQDIAHGHGLLFIDPHGDAIDDILRRLPCREEDVIYFDPFDRDFAFGLNLFECDKTDRRQVSRTVNYVLHMFAKLFTEKGDLAREAPTMDETMQHTAELLIDNQDLLIDNKLLGITMAEIPWIFNYEEARQRLTPQLTDDHEQGREFWREYEKDKRDEQNEQVASTKRRISKFLSDPYIKHCIGQVISTIDFREIIDTKKILLVKLSRDEELLTNFIGSILIGKLLNTIYADTTPEDERIDFSLYCDEFQNFATPEFAKLFTETGKWHIMPTVSNQVGSLLEYKIRGPIATAAIKVLYQLTEDDAQEFASALAKKPPPAETRREAKLTVVPDLVYRIVPDAPSRDKVFVSRILHPDKRVNDFIESLIQKLRYSGAVDCRDSFNRDLNGICSVISDIFQVEFVKKLNMLLYEVMTEHNPHKELSVDLLEIMVRAFTPAFFDNDRFYKWILEARIPAPMPDPHPRHRGEMLTFSGYFTKRNYSPSYCGLAPRDYCSTLFINGVGGYRMLESTPDKLQGKDLNKWYEDRREKVPDDLAQAYRLLWMAEDEQHLIDSFHRYEQVLRKVLTEQLRKELPYHLKYHSLKFDDPLGNGDKPSFPILAENFRSGFIHEQGSIVIQQILAWINKNGKDFVWQYDRQERYWEFTKDQGKLCIERLAAEIDLEPEIDHIISSGKPSFEAFIREIRAVMQALASEPVAVQGGVYEAVPGIQRTFADMVNEMVSEFIDLPRYTAYCRMVKEVGGRQFVLKYKLYPYPLPQADNQAVYKERLERIIARTRQTYCTSRKQVEEEIKVRKEALTAPLRKIAKARTGDEAKTPLSPAQLQKLQIIQTVLGKDYDRFINDPAVQHQDNLKRLLEKGIDAHLIKKALDSWYDAGSPANVSPFAELIK